MGRLRQGRLVGLGWIDRDAVFWLCFMREEPLFSLRVYISENLVCGCGVRVRRGEAFSCTVQARRVRML